MKINLFYLAVFLLLSGCRKFCYESRGIEGAGLTITFFNTANNEYFYPVNTALSPYRIDSLKAQDSRGNLLRTPYQTNSDPINPLKSFYVASIYPIFIPQDDQAAFETEQTKDIFIRYNYNTFDTIRLVYKAKKEKCANKYEYIKAYYRNNLIAESYNLYADNLRFKLNH